MIDAGGERFAAEIGARQIIGRRRDQSGKSGVGDRIISVRLGCGTVGCVKGAVDDDAGRKAGNGRAGTNPDTAGDLTRSRVGHGRCAQDGKILG